MSERIGSPSKSCFECGFRLPSTEAYFQRDPKSGGLRRTCKACQREAQGKQFAAGAHAMRLRGTMIVESLERARG